MKIHPQIFLDKKPLNWFIPGTLSILAPGLGQLYNGKRKKGFMLLSVFLSLRITNILLLAIHSQSMIFTLPSFFLWFLVWMYALIDGIHQGVSTKIVHQKQFLKNWIIHAIILLFFLSIHFWFFLEFRPKVMTNFRISGPSMYPAILIDDYLFINRRIYKYHSPQKGDIVLIQSGTDESSFYIKRIIGLPLDTLEIKSKKIMINNSPFMEEYVFHADPNIQPSVNGSRDYFGPIVIPRESYFVMGDNRDISIDSRYWGPIPRSAIKGRGSFIYLSKQQKFPFIRFNRLGKTVD